jgi:hypothetical protein
VRCTKHTHTHTHTRTRTEILRVRAYASYPVSTPPHPHPPPFLPSSSHFHISLLITTSHYTIVEANIAMTKMTKLLQWQIQICFCMPNESVRHRLTSTNEHRDKWSTVTSCETRCYGGERRKVESNLQIERRPDVFFQCRKTYKNLQ